MASEASCSQDDTCLSNGRGSRCIDSELLEWARSKLYVLPDGSTVDYAAPGPPGNTLNPQANLSLSQSARARHKRQSVTEIPLSNVPDGTDYVSDEFVARDMKAMLWMNMMTIAMEARGPDDDQWRSVSSDGESETSDKIDSEGLEEPTE